MSFFFQMKTMSNWILFVSKKLRDQKEQICPQFVLWLKSAPSNGVTHLFNIGLYFFPLSHTLKGIVQHSENTMLFIWFMVRWDNHSCLQSLEFLLTTTSTIIPFHMHMSENMTDSIMATQDVFFFSFFFFCLFSNCSSQERTFQS